MLEHFIFNAMNMKIHYKQLETPISIESIFHLYFMRSRMNKCGLYDISFYVFLSPTYM